MIRYLTKHDHFWRATAVDECAVITTGRIGEAGDTTEVNTYETMQTPPEWALDALAKQPLADGFVATPIPHVHLEIEESFDISLPSAVREFYEKQTYLKYQGYACAALQCHVDFVADSVLGNYSQEHYCRKLEAARHFIPISARMINGSEDEQSWIGIDPKEADGPVYGLYTSGEFEPSFDDFAAFLTSLEPPQ